MKLDISRGVTILAVLCICTLYSVIGDCLHSGRVYMKHTVWQPGPCTVCTCDDPIVLCETIPCTDPRCDYSQGEYLQIAADACCPECVPKLSPCVYQNRTIPHNTEWRPEPCRSCLCINTEVTCSKVPCPLTHCKPGEVTQNLPGQCCPQCIPSGRSCTFHGQRYDDGSEWEILPCTKCVCRDGQASCYPIYCPSVVCPKNEHLETLQGACCPVCQGDNSTCRDEGQEYRTGQQWQRSPCTLCVCIGGTIVCTEKECDDLLMCNMDDIQITREGECCPQCVPKRGVCEDEIPTRYSGDIWNVSNCEYCACQNGEITCHTAVCEHIQCSKGEVQVTLPGKCCPLCVMPPPCDFNELSYQDGDTWHSDPCTVCDCKSGEITCYKKQCPACSQDSVLVALPGTCCGECKTVKCDDECTECRPGDPEYCIKCRMEDMKVQDGRCVQSCRVGFYGSHTGQCEPCDETCYTCFQGTPYHCDMCQPGLMWKHGQCVPQCGAGYYLQNGKCLVCDYRCTSCSGPNADQCLSCSNVAQVLFRGECLDYCPDNFFIRAGSCVACHPTCKTCTPDGTSCATCWQGGLLQQGQCVTRCQVGYYPNFQSSCSPCHPGCESCDGGSISNCTSCFGAGKVNKKGRCRDTCPKGSFFTIQGTCENCETGCNSCHVTWDGQTSVCSGCADNKLVSFGSTCVTECPEGYYQEHKVCKVCGSNCLECKSPGECLRCSPDLLLYQGQCVAHCGQGQYEDGVTTSCKDCTKDCLRCYSERECTLCNSLSFAKDDRCMRECGNGFITRFNKRECEHNIAAPTFQILSHIEVEEGAIAPLEMSMFYLADQDTSTDKLRISITIMPSNGDIIKAVDGRDVILRTSDFFTLQDIMTGTVRFVHDSFLPDKGFAVLTVTDGQLSSPVVELYFQAITTHGLTLINNLPLYARGGDVTSLGPEVIDLNTEGSANDVTITVLHGPSEGSIVRKNVEAEVHHFTLQDLRYGQVEYNHNPQASAGTDSLLLQATDGYNVITFILNIQVRPQENVVPILVHNKMGHVNLGDMLQLTSELLMAKVMDHNSTRIDDVIYTLVPPLNNPQEGEIMMVLPIPSTGVGRGWEDIGDDYMAARMSRFRQRDINEGRIWYRNKGTATLTDTVRFEIADNSSPSNILTDQNFYIAVMDENMFGALTEPTLAPGVRLGMSVLENQLIPITSVNLAFRDPDTADDGILYTVTRPLNERDGQLEHIENPFKPITRFSQDDINNNRIIYRPPQVEIGHREKEVVFYFTVSDGLTEDSTKEQKFTIRIIPVNNMAPRFRTDVPSFTVSQGGKVPIGQSGLGISDPDTPTSDLTVSLAGEPQYGQFEKVKEGLRVVLRRGDVFTFKEVEENAFQYRHDGSGSMLSDALLLSVSDGVHETAVRLNITILKVDKSAPYMLPSATCRITVMEGSSVMVKRADLSFVDNEDSDDLLQVKLTSDAGHGRLEKQRQHIENGQTFTQADINNLYISFVSDSEIGKKAVTEVLTFNVTDTNNNILPSQFLSVLIQPVDNQSPTLKLTDTKQVEEASKVTLTENDITLSDIDTSLDDLIVVIETKPSFGNIIDISPVEGSEHLENRLVSSFPYRDVLSGYVLYSQSDHENKEPVHDSFLLHATDGKNKSPTSRFNFTILPSNDEAPQIFTEQVFVQEGQPVVISNASVYAVDLDTDPDHLIFTLDTVPLHGNIRKKTNIMDLLSETELLVLSSQFTYRDILNELLVYEQDGSEVTTDSFSLGLSDGQSKDSRTVSVIIGLVSDETPRVIINRGIRVQADTVTAIKSEDLRVSDVDSEDNNLLFTVTKDLSHGRLVLNQEQKITVISDKGSLRSFTQRDIDMGDISYEHRAEERTGNDLFKFTVSDPEGNNLIDQEFYITVLEDRFPPVSVVNKEMLVSEGGQVKITTEYLSFTDDDSEPALLQYVIIEAPTLGHLELTRHPGVPISDFHQSDLAASNVLYIHTSSEEIYLDKVLFYVSDGTNKVIQTFFISVIPVDDSIPVVTNNGLQVQEGVRKLITEFDLKAIDKDTKEDSVLFTVVQPPINGKVEVHRDGSWSSASVFSMSDIYENHVSYQHDGTESLSDNFSFVVSDGTNQQFAAMMQDGLSDRPITQTHPQDFNIEILPMDDGSPILEVNLGLQFLESHGPVIANIITATELKATDIDTSPDKITFVVTKVPEHGRLEKISHPGEDLMSFTQADIYKHLVRYVLLDNAEAARDSFTFNIQDTKPNRVPGNMFHITWSVVSFERLLFNVTETAGVIRVPVIRTGNTKQYSIVTCRTVSGKATSSTQGAQPGLNDYKEFAGQVQFDEWQDTKVCTIIISDDSIFEGPEDFYVELVHPTFALLGSMRKTTVVIYDIEDEPILQFEKSLYNVNESDAYVMAAITRTGDMSSTVSVVCSTVPLTARGSPYNTLDSGSDFVSRGNTNSYRVVLPAGVTMATCDVKLIDDSIHESSEQFDLLLSLPSFGSSLGPVTMATVVIEGPNDESSLYFSLASYYFDENAGVVNVEILREGTDLSHSSTVWCATRLASPLSATPGQDYVPSSSQISFGPGATTQKCQLTILDDDINPRVEGNETFTVFLSSAVGSSLKQPYIASVYIQDSLLDVPTIQFLEAHYNVDEGNKSINVPVYRSGDLSYQSSVICYTRQKTAQVMMDYEERYLSEISRITFEPGDKVHNCTVGIVDDDNYEENEVFLLRLAQPLGTENCDARLGDFNTTTITITNADDVPILNFEKAAYSIQEPSAVDQVVTVTVRVVRSGDVTKAASVRCSTRDGSAMSGIDYNPKSQILEFAEGVRSLNFPVDVLYNNDIEWHETFSVILGPTDPVGAELGPVHSATITILDNDVSGSLVLPTYPVVVSLLHYDNVEDGLKVNPSPGYPLVCVTPCDIHSPSYAITHTLCQESNINQTSMMYRWEAAIPTTAGSRPPFIDIAYNTVFTSVNKMVLDSVYFRPSFKIRCVAQPIQDNGNPGIPLKSKPVTIGRDNGICNAPVFTGAAYSYQAQSFLASLEYVGPYDLHHPNTIHISVKVPHQDGMLPLISTFPLHNLRFLLSEPVYRQQHICSNIITPQERAPLIESGFLSGQTSSNLYGLGYEFPFQFDNSLRENKTLLLYKHLNMKKCVWEFNAWYHMTDLIDLCGGHAVSDFQVNDGGQTFLSIRVPLHVSYLYATAPIGWGSLEHRTEMEFSFFYDTVLWRSGLETEGELGGRLQVTRIQIGKDGKLVIDFKTQAKFRGLYVLEHHTLPGYESRLVAPDKLINFQLELLWEQSTFDGPYQLFRASSDYNLKDYTGEYMLEMIPCTVLPSQGYTRQTPVPCAAHQPARFEVPIAFQQTNRPVPLEYTLNTHFQLNNNEEMFLMDPSGSNMDLEEMDFNGAFGNGENLYGRVLWSPDQDLKEAYKLMIEKVYLCTGRDGHIPTYDPSGEVYNDGPQYGCIQPGPKLRHRFLILDRGNPDVTTRKFQDVSFEAEFADDNLAYAALQGLPGVDGFVFSIDPLYKVTAGYQWHLQVIYLIGPSDPSLHRYRNRRSTVISLGKRDAGDALAQRGGLLENNGSKNGTNIRMIHLNVTEVSQLSSKTQDPSAVSIVVPVVAVVIVLCAIIVLLVLYRRRRHKESKPPPKTNNLEVAKQNSFVCRSSASIVKCSNSDIELRNTMVYQSEKNVTVRVKNTNIEKNKNINNINNGTEV